MFSMSLRKQWNVQHVTTTHTPSLGANPTGKSLNSLQSIYVLGQVRIPNRDSIYIQDEDGPKLHTTVSAFQY